MILSLDTETALIQPGLAAPPLACVSWANEQHGTGLFHGKNEAEIIRLVEGLTGLIGANIAYDACTISQAYPQLLKKFFDLYRDLRVKDVLIAQKLVDIAEGRLGGFWTSSGFFKKFFYSLDEVWQRHGQAPMDKNTWRLGYGQLIDVPLVEWPEGARAYPETDAGAPMGLLQHLEEEYPDYLKDLAAQTSAAFPLALMSARGIRTDPERVAALIQSTEADIAKALTVIQAAGLADAKGKKNMAPARARMLAVCEREGIPLKVTEKGQELQGEESEQFLSAQEVRSQGLEGQLSLDEDACNTSGDEVLKAFSTYSTARTLRTRVATLELGTLVPLQTRFDSLIYTGRTSSQKPGRGREKLTLEKIQDYVSRIKAGEPILGAFGDNFQNPPQKGGYRECIVPRPGYIFCSVDFDAAELRCLAQVCLWTVGESRLAEVLNSGRDPHSMMASTMLAMEYLDFIALRKSGDKRAKQFRDRSKGPNFGLPGGMGPAGLVRYMRASKPSIHITLAEAADLIEYWHTTWPEMRKYFRWVKNQPDQITQFISGRIRGGASYCSRCNSFFQGLQGDAIKSALLPLARECYLEEERSPLYGSRPVLLVHDEVIAELPIAVQHEAAYRMRDIMVSNFNRYTPDVPVTASPALMSRWSKEAVELLEGGRLVDGYKEAA